MKQLPRQLKRNKCFARACGERQQHTVVALGHRFQHAVDGAFLVVATCPCAAFVFERHGGKVFAPRGSLCFAFAKGQLPKLVGRGVVGQLALSPRVHVDAVNALPVGGVGVANGQLSRVALGLRHPLGQRLAPGFGLDHRQLGVAVHQHIVGNVSPRSAASTLQATRRDAVLAQNAAAFHYAPACGCKGWVDVFGAGFGFVHLLDFFLVAMAFGLVGGAR